MLGSFCHAQTSDFIVTTTHDTIDVDKITLTAFDIKTKLADQKKKYKMDDITAYYIFSENKHYERIALEKKEFKEPDPYDYRRNENIQIAEYENRKKYKYIQRLTTGKVKLFTEFVAESGITLGVPIPTGAVTGAVTAIKNELYYISVYDSKLEVLGDYGKLKLTKQVYDLLKIYLYGNAKVTKQLDAWLVLKPKADLEKIVGLINEYNVWAAVSK